MKIPSTRNRSGLPLLAASLLLAACGSDRADIMGSAVELVELSNNSVPDAHVRLAKRGPAGTTATFSISATGGNLPAGSVVTLEACADGATICDFADVWTPTDDAIVLLTITEISTTGNVVFDFIGASTHLDGDIVISAPAEPTITFRTDNTGSSFVRFKNVEGPPQLPSLRLEKTAANGTVNAGSSMSFSMTVFSDGPGTATGVTLSDPLPGGAGIVWQTASADCSIDGSAPAQTLNCTFGDLAAGEMRTAIVTSGTTTETECKTYANTATVNASNHVSVESSAQITVENCAPPGSGETATGMGTTYPGSANWFMYSAYSTSKTDLVTGPNHEDVGDIFMSRSSGVTTIVITLHSGWTWDGVAENLKIQPFNNAPTGWVEPGSFSHKWTVSGTTATVTITGTSAKFYGIHADVRG